MIARCSLSSLSLLFALTFGSSSAAGQPGAPSEPSSAVEKAPPPLGPRAPHRGAVRTRPLDAAFLRGGIPVVDLRAPREWSMTGVVPGSHLVNLFDDRGGHDLPGFLARLEATVDTGEPFALLCTTGVRTRQVSRLLAGEFGYRVVDLAGGIVQASRSGVRLVPPEEVAIESGDSGPGP